jgi:hypothetical protein
VEVDPGGRRDRVDLGVRAAVLLVPALPDHLVVLDDHRPDDRIRTDPAHAALRERDRPREMLVVGLGALHDPDYSSWPANRLGRGLAIR